MTLGRLRSASRERHVNEAFARTREALVRGHQRGGLAPGEDRIERVMRAEAIALRESCGEQRRQRDTVDLHGLEACQDLGALVRREQPLADESPDTGQSLGIEVRRDLDLFAPEGILDDCCRGSTRDEVYRRRRVEDDQSRSHRASRSSRS
ncbi:MAG TPA: hypothetical protein VGA16_08630 [Candidatus Limnocylindria bacterium]